MQVVLVGLNHKTAPVEVREQMAFDSRATEDALRRLKAEFPSSEFILLSTCNRVECYAAVKREDGPGPEELGAFLSQIKGVDHDQVNSHLYQDRGRGCSASYDGCLQP